jgi:lysophospholipase L1-like esterase
VFTGGGGNFTQTLDYNYNTQLPIWTIDATYTVGTPGATTWGIGIGLRSNASSGNLQPVDLRMDASTAASAGNVTLESGPSHTQLAPASPEVISFNAGDTIRSYLTRVYDTISGFVLDVNTGSIASVSYQYVFNSSASGAGNNAPNIGTFSIYNLGGTQTLTSLKISSGLPKGADIACVGDSKTVGYWAGSFASGWCMQLQGSFRAYQLAGGYGQSADLLADVPEIIALVPKYAIVMTGGNDRRYSVPLATTESNISTAVSALQAAGITVYVTTYPVENSGVNMASLNSWILATYPTNSIDINNGFSQTGSGVPSAWLNADGIHPSSYFHSSIAQQIATRLQRDSAKEQFPFYVTP